MTLSDRISPRSSSVAIAQLQRDVEALKREKLVASGGGGSALPAIYLYRRRAVNNQTIAGTGAGVRLEFRQARTNDPSHAIFQPVQAYDDPQGFPAWPTSETAWLGNNNICKGVRIREPGLYAASLTIRTEAETPLTSALIVNNYYETDVPNFDQRGQMSLDHANDYWDGSPSIHFVVGTEDFSVAGSEKAMYVHGELANSSGSSITLQGSVRLAIVQLVSGTDFGSDIAI